ncbi:MAG: MipA/OmpV family protein [Methylobacterium mesophilicum]|nr:MipA/OmpV family protein [Methylobacterium mesophilicum]
MRVALAGGLAAFTLAFAAPATAQDAATPPAPETPADPAAAIGGDSLTVGGALVYLSDYEGSNDYRFVPAPGAIGSYKGFSFLIAGNRASVDLIPNKPGPVWDIQAGPIAVVNFNRSGIENIKDRRVRALGERDTAIEVGGYVGIGKTGVITSPYDKLSVSLSYRHDVSGVHDSGIWQPTINYLTPLSRKAAVALFFSAEHADRGYGRAYFDVSQAGSVASGLPVFTTRGGWKNWNVGGLATYSITGDLLKGFKIVAGGTYRRMLNDFGDSPVVSVAGSRGQWLGAVGLAYTF